MTLIHPITAKPVIATSAVAIAIGQKVSDGAAPSNWTPADYIPGVGESWWAFDAEGPAYTETGTPTTLAVNNNDYVGIIPNINQAANSEYNFQYLKAYGGDLGYRWKLRTTDLTHPRVWVPNDTVGGFLNPNGDLTNYRRGGSPSIYAFRVRLGYAAGAWVILGVDNSPFSGPGLGTSGNSLQYDPSGITGGVSTGILVSGEVGDWLSFVMTISTADGVKIYKNDPVTPIFSGVDVPGEVFNRVLFYTTGNVNFALRRVLLGSKYNPELVTVADVMDWLSRAV